MGVSRSGYYKWKNKEPSEREINREKMIALVSAIHEEHKTHGYRWTAAFIRINYGFEISDNYAYKCFRYLGIKAETKHKIHQRPRKVKDKYPNLVEKYHDIYNNKNKEFWKELSKEIEEYCKINNIKYINYFYHEELVKK